jgi:nitroreductase
MVRAYEDRAVPDDVLDRVLDAARRAPSAGNSQGVDFVVLTGDDVRRYWSITLPDPEGFGFDGLLTAPVLVIPLVSAARYTARYSEGDKAAHGLGDESAWPVPYWWVDGGAAVQNLLLSVVAEGLGACFFGLFDHEADVLAWLGVPDDRRALGTVSLGYPAPDPPGLSASRPRRPLGEVVHRGRW